MYFCLNSFCIGLGKRVFDNVRDPFFIYIKSNIIKRFLPELHTFRI